MVTKQMFKQMRDWLQLGIYKVINPVVKLMIKVGITPNVVTTIGFLGNLVAAVLLVYGAHNTISPENGLCYIGWAGGVIILFSLFDMLDGQVARLGVMTSTFGALYDSVLDRYSELFTLGGICYYMLETGYVTGSIITFVALVGSMMVSYVRARAEG
ncbi:MAG: CDP-alcohol phosphatidyltransferase family protein, partial [Muribaculaceae bacterium]|nr:CDP-alcohol phosphatidyltransferase family protein [Muribaculaceae bacterium]